MGLPAPSSFFGYRDFMYPVMSLLRRAAAKLVYLRDEHIVVKGNGRAFINVGGNKANWVHPAKVGWQKPVDLVPLFALQVEGKSAEEVAWKLTKKENEIAEAFNAPEAMFTLVLGEEKEEVLEDGLHRRIFRLGIIRGVFHHQRGDLERIPPKETQKATFRKLPPGVVPERH